jgi:hypothetical protein
MSHNYDYSNISTCKGCKRIHNQYGDTDAQIDMPHEIELVKISNKSSKKNKRSRSPIEFSLQSETVSSVYLEPLNTYSHNYNYGDIGKCKECTRIHDEFGDTDAQIDIPHAFEPMSNKKVNSNKKRKRVKSAKKVKRSKGGKTHKKGINKNTKKLI